MSVVPRIRQTSPLAPAVAGPRPLPRSQGGGLPGPNHEPGGYMRGEQSSVFDRWAPMPRDVSDMTRGAYTLAAGRAVDVIVNSGWLTGMIEQAVANAVGADGLRLSAQPDAATLGWDDDYASDWGARVEDRFNLWARNPDECDIEGRRTLAQMQAASYRAWFGPGEILSESAWKRVRGCTYGTKIRLIPAHRLSQRTGLPRLIQGVQMDADWRPTSYWFWRRQFPNGGEQEIEVPARDANGRPRIVHAFDGLPGQYRGISPMVSALESSRRFDQLTGATLTANLIRAVFAATIKSEEPTEEVLKGLLTPKERAKMESEQLTAFDVWQSMNEGWYQDGALIDLNKNGRFAHLFPGQELEFHHAGNTTGDYKEMTKIIMLEITRCLGLTYESGTGDYNGATYASVNNAQNDIFEVTKMRRKNVIAPAFSPHFVAWLEEDIAFGRTPFPGGLDAFRAQRNAACRHDWIGSPRPQADQLKAQRSHEGYRNMGVLSDSDICADLGRDVLDVYRQRAREMALRKRLGLPESGPPATPDPNEERDEDRPDEEAKD